MNRRVFVQSNDLEILHKLHRDGKGPWETDHLEKYGPQKSPIGAWQDKEHEPRYLYTTTKGKVEDWCGKYYGGWDKGGFDDEIAEGSRLFCFDDDQEDCLWVYMQSKSNPSKITEWRGGGWKVTGLLPPDN